MASFLSSFGYRVLYSGALLVSLLSTLPLLARANPATHLEHFSLLGPSTKIRQIRARFSADMVPFADPRVKSDALSVACSGGEDLPSGSARWADTKVWLYEFSRHLPAGVVCTVTPSPALTDARGAAVAPFATQQFSTGGPLITRTMPRAGDTIDEDQVFLLQLNGQVDKASVRAHAYFTSDQIENRISAEVVDEDTRDELLKTQYLSEEDKRDAVFIGLKARQRFAQNASVMLHWDKGISSPQGITSETGQQFSFSVRGPFALTASCERTRANAGCIPFQPIRLQFSSPARRSEASRIILRSEDGTKTFTPMVESYEGASAYVNSLTVKGPFPEQSRLEIVLPRTLTDDAGRPLVPVAPEDRFISIDEPPPLAKFAASFGVIEWNGSAAIPITVRNIEPELLTRLLDDQALARMYMDEKGQSLPARLARISSLGRMQQWIRLLERRDDHESLFLPGEYDADTAPRADVEDLETLRIPRPEGEKSFEVMGIPVKRPGFYLVEVESPRLAQAYASKNGRFFIRSAALVTNLGVHFKWSKEQSLIWVTFLDSAAPAKGARVAVSDCHGKVYWQGESDARGIALPRGIPALGADLPRCGSVSGLFASASLSTHGQEDFSFTSTSWNQGIEGWRFGVPIDYSSSPLVAHTTFAENLLRRGRTAHFKIFLRAKTSSGMRIPTNAELPSSASLRHQGSDEEIAVPIQWRRNGTAEGSWVIPSSATLGTYTLQLGFDKRRAPPQDPITAGSFEVQDFRVPLMQARLKSPPEVLVAPLNVPFDIAISYLSGGAASGLSTVMRTIYQPLNVSFSEEFPGFSFLSGSVKTGLFRSEQEAEETGEESHDEGDLPTGVQRNELILDNNGTASFSATAIRGARRPYEITSEIEYRDPNGEVQTTRGSAQVWPAEIAIGLKAEGWTGERGMVSVRAAALSPRGVPLADQPLTLRLFRVKTFSHRKRLVGGFYGYENSVERTLVGNFCEGRTDFRGMLDCQRSVAESGEFLIEASTTDSNGRRASTFVSAWVSNQTDWWFAQNESDRIDLLAAKKTYEVGEVAKLQVRSPFSRATALVSVEREGVIETSVQELLGSEPVISLPMKASFAPNVYVSVLLVRGRIGEVQPTALLDLGKPAIKLGIAELKVSRLPHTLHVKVATDESTYAVRGTAKAKIIVQSADGSPLPRDTDVAVAVVDEALLELRSNDSWELLEGMMQRRPYGVATSSAQLQVVGKRHFGLKAMPTGGGGGAQNTRELFDTLLLWNGRLSLSAAGTAEVSIPLNDSLSRFRVVAIASGGTAKFGTGFTSFTTSQDLMLLPGVAPIAREGDRSMVGATLRNTTSTPMHVVVSLHSVRTPRSSEESGSGAYTFEPQSRILEPNSSVRVRWDLLVPRDTKALVHELSVSEHAGSHRSDRVRITQQVHSPLRPTVIQATLQQLSGPVELPIETPADAVAGLGGIGVSFSPSLLNGAEGLRSFMLQYPYTCLEQQASRAVALDDRALWESVAASMHAFLDSRGLLKYFPTMTEGSSDLTSYVLSLAAAARFPLPAAVKDRTVAALAKVATGELLPAEVTSGSGNVTQSRIAALAAVSRYEPPRASVVASIDPDLRLLPTVSIAQWWSILSRTKDLPQSSDLLNATMNELNARLDYQGTMLMLSSTTQDKAWWFMSSVDRALNELLFVALEEDAWREDMGKLVRGALERQKNGAWGLTTANAWGALMLRSYAQSFETVPVQGVSTATLRSTGEHEAPPFLSVDWSTRGTAPQAKTRNRQAASWATHPSALSLPSSVVAFPSTPSILTLRHQGTGAPWAFVQSIASIPLKAPLASGYRVTRELVAVERRDPSTWSEGDILKVKLTIEAQADRTWTVVDDPIPAGATILGTTNRSRSLAAENTSAADESDEYWNWSAPVFVERSFTGLRAYYDYFPKGQTTLEYTVRLNAPGTYQLPPTRVEAMYSPEMFGESPNPPLDVATVEQAN
jgi:uncharacterized protein YfaS (alpha-2-macroglobulin family)